MKIICNQKLLANKIGIVQKAINSKTTLDLLKGVLIVTKQDEIILKGYDLEVVDSVLKEYNFSLSSRAEELPVIVFVKISNALTDE